MNSFAHFIAASVAVISTIMLLSAVSADDRVLSLPGIDISNFNFSMYSGYVNVNASHGRYLFYYLVESQNSPSNDPLVLWANGGPGCSSVGGGLMSENGPFYPDTKGQNLTLNPYSWNRAANIVYLEFPAGVGFSYTNTPSDYVVGDVQTALDNVQFLLGFFQKYPQYANRPLWLTGESYGGHYLVNFAHAIVASNKAGVNPKINLQGYMAGNAWTDATYDNAGAAEFFYTTGINSYETWQGLASFCDFSNIGPLKGAYGSPDPLKCQHFQSKSTSEMGDINIYMPVSPTCISSSSSVTKRGARNGDAAQLIKLLAKGNGSESSEFDSMLGAMAKNYFARKLVNDPIDPAGYDVCIDDHVSIYLNRAEVQSAIHANIPYAWNLCSPLVQYSDSDLLSSVIPQLRDNIDAGLKILYYSGSSDAIVPHLGTQLWIRSMNLGINEAWRPWTASDKQVGGYVVQYDGFTFATVRGAGHMVPYTQPLFAYDMFSRFLKGQSL